MPQWDKSLRYIPQKKKFENDGGRRSHFWSSYSSGFSGVGGKGGQGRSGIEAPSWRKQPVSGLVEGSGVKNLGGGSAVMQPGMEHVVGDTVAAKEKAMELVKVNKSAENEEMVLGGVDVVGEKKEGGMFDPAGSRVNSAIQPMHVDSVNMKQGAKQVAAEQKNKKGTYKRKVRDGACNAEKVVAHGGGKRSREEEDMEVVGGERKKVFVPTDGGNGSETFEAGLEEQLREHK